MPGRCISGVLKQSSGPCRLLHQQYIYIGAFISKLAAIAAHIWGSSRQSSPSSSLPLFHSPLSWLSCWIYVWRKALPTCLSWPHHNHYSIFGISFKQARISYCPSSSPNNIEVPSRTVSARSYKKTLVEYNTLKPGVDKQNGKSKTNHSNTSPDRSARHFQRATFLLQYWKTVNEVLQNKLKKQSFYRASWRSQTIYLCIFLSDIQWFDPVYFPREGSVIRLKLEGKIFDLFKQSNL